MTMVTKRDFEERVGSFCLIHPPSRFAYVIMEGNATRVIWSGEGCEGNMEFQHTWI